MKKINFLLYVKILRVQNSYAARLKNRNTYVSILVVGLVLYFVKIIRFSERPQERVHYGGVSMVLRKIVISHKMDRNLKHIYFNVSYMRKYRLRKKNHNMGTLSRYSDVCRTQVRKSHDLS